MKKLSLLTLIYCFYFSSAIFAAVISPSSIELNFNFQASFFTSEFNRKANHIADDHASHMFGLFHSSTTINKFGLDSSLVGGVAAPLMPLSINIISDQTQSGVRQITYTASGKLLVQKPVATQWLQIKTITLPMPYDLDSFYDKNCTSTTYDSQGDFWYFYDAFQAGCEKFTTSPLASNVTFNFTPNKDSKTEYRPKLDQIRGDNGNGEDLVITYIHGFAHDPKEKSDDGRVNYNTVNERLKAKGFTTTIIRRTSTSPAVLLEKQTKDANGKNINIKIYHYLVETSLSSRSKLFAQFFKDAIENADVLIYAGHSGLGGNLDIPSLEDKAGEFEFNPNKKQILFFNSCSSYSYYLNQFSEIKRKSKIDVLTNGLSSYFYTAPDIELKFLETIIDPSKNPTWTEILKYMESDLGGENYMLNVGAI